MEQIKIVASRRPQGGKGNARRLRAEGHIPAVAYGRDLAAMPLSVSPKDLLNVLASEHGRNSVVELELEGDKFTALLADYQYHPVTRSLLHADFLHIHLDKPVEVDVPLELTGKPAGVVVGGILRQVFRKLPIRCLPAQIPVKIVHDVTELELDDAVPVSALALPEGVVVRLPAEQTVAAVVTEKKRGEAEEEAEAAAAAAAAVPAEAGAEPDAKAKPDAKA
jgi:large subunit ribosomal protein L25